MNCLDLIHLSDFKYQTIFLKVYPMSPLLTYWAYAPGGSEAQNQSFNNGTNNIQSIFFHISKNSFLGSIPCITFMAV